MDWLIDFFSQNFSSCIWLAVILVALIPTLESKIAIPFAMNTAIWGYSALPAWQAFLFAFIGSILPCLPCMLLARKIRRHTAGFVTDTFTKRYNVKTSLIEKQKSNFKKYFTLMSFVALPLPLTGVWTGSFVAGLSKLNFKQSFLSICIGALISCGIITLLCVYFENSIGYVLFVSLALVVIVLLFDLVGGLIKPLFKRTKNK